MEERILQLAVSELEYNGTISFWEYTIEKRYSWTFINEWNKRIWVFVDWAYFINWYWNKSYFESSVMNNLFVFVDFISKKVEELHKQNSDYYFTVSRLEKEKSELEEKISDKVVEETQENLSDKDF